MNRVIPFRKIWIFIIPAMVLTWSIFFLKLSGPFYQTRIDPDYVYLLNGLNCATLEFSRIGHIDHPGTPFQVITGIFIRITHLVAGQGPIVDDVISRPEFYLTVLAFYLSLLTALTLLWLGQMVLKFGNDYLGAIILQLSLFFNIFLIDLPCRYIPDRMLSLVVLLFAGNCIRYFYINNLSDRKFAFQSGILMGFGFVTKFNFLPILVIPFFLVRKAKEKVIYVSTFIVSSVIFFLPVHDKFSYFRSFITSIIKHDGLYGGGSQQVFNLDVFWQNTILILRQNTAFSVILILTLVAIVMLILNPIKRNLHRKELLYLISMILATLIGVIITAKHFKDYYIIPIITLTGFSTYILLVIGRTYLKSRYTSYVFLLLTAYFLYLPAAYLYHPYKDRPKYNYNNALTADFINKNISQNDYFIVEPTWMSGPLIANGLAYALSYVANRNLYFNNFEKYYPNILTWNGKDRPLELIRTVEANNESIFKSGKNLYLLSTPGRNAGTIANYIDSCAAKIGISFQRDTVYHNSIINNTLIRFQNLSGWHEQLHYKISFERFDQNSVLTDDECYSFTGQMNITDLFASNGFHSLEINGEPAISPEITILGVSVGDYIEITLKRYRNASGENGNMLLGIKGEDGIFKTLAQGQLVSPIHSDWELLRLAAEITEVSYNGTVSFYYEGIKNNVAFIDDISVRHYTNKSNSGTIAISAISNLNLFKNQPKVYGWFIGLISPKPSS